MSVINPVISQVIRPVTQPPTKPPKGGGGGGNRDAQLVDVTFGRTETAAGSYTVPMPQNAVSGELLVAVVYCAGAIQSMSTATSGWTRRDQLDTGDARFAAIFTKTAAGSDASLVVTAGTGTGRWLHYVFVVDNADTSAPIFDNNLDYVSTSVASLSLASLSTDSKNDLCIGFAAASVSTGITSMSGSGWTDLGTQIDSANSISGAAAYKNANNNRTSGALTANYAGSASNNVYGQIIVKASGGKASGSSRISFYSTLSAAESSGDTWTNGQAVYVTGSSGSGAVQFKYYTALDQT